MKTIVFILLVATSSIKAVAQDHNKPVDQKQIGSPANDFDFWIGNWETAASTPPKWEPKAGVDSIRYLLNGTLIEEVFTKENGANFQRGYLFYLKREGRWKHTIYDTKWGEYSFYGNKEEGGSIVLYSDPKSTRPGLRKETFYNITESNFDYKWEASQDGGETWIIIWKVHYEKL